MPVSPPTSSTPEAVLISSKLTRFYKHIVPKLWLCLAAMFAINSVMDAVAGNLPAGAVAVAVLIIFGIAALSCFVLRLLNARVADEVWDCGHDLLIRIGATEETIPVRAIDDVKFQRFISPHRATLILSEESVFGTEIVFLPATGGIPYRTPPAIKELQSHVRRARQRRDRER